MAPLAFLFKRLVLLLLGGFVGVYVFVQATAGYYLLTEPAPEDLPRADAIVVLSAGLNDHDNSLDDGTFARTEKGLALWRAGVADRIIMSGGLDKESGLLIAERMKDHVVAAGVPEDQVVAESRSISTFENARFSYEIASREGWRRLVVVTDARHLFRSWLLFEFWKGDRPFDIVALSPADDMAGQSFEFSLWRSVRETLAYPFNVVKLIGQLGLEALGRGDERIVR